MPLEPSDNLTQEPMISFSPFYHKKCCNLHLLSACIYHRPLFLFNKYKKGGGDLEKQLDHCKDVSS